MIAIIGAMQEEVEAILNIMDEVAREEIYNIHFYKGLINQKEVVLCKSGVGKVNASMSTSILILKYSPEIIINIGTAGGLVESQNTLDIVISENLIQHDYNTSYIDGDEGIGIYSKSDDVLRNKIIKEFENLKEEVDIHVGDIISGDIFVGDEKKIVELKNKFPKAIACDMESGAIAQVANKMNIPFIVIRSLSDIVFHDNSGIDFYKNLLKTSDRSAKMLEKFIERY